MTASPTTNKNVQSVSGITVRLAGDSTIALLFMLIFATGFLRQYMVLVASLTAYGVSTLVCVIISLMGNEYFDFDLIKERVGDYDKKAKTPSSPKT